MERELETSAVQQAVNLTEELNTYKEKSFNLEIYAIKKKSNWLLIKEMATFWSVFFLLSPLLSNLFSQPYFPYSISLLSIVGFFIAFVANQILSDIKCKPTMFNKVTNFFNKPFHSQRQDFNIALADLKMKTAFIADPYNQEEIQELFEENGPHGATKEAQEHLFFYKTFNDSIERRDFVEAAWAAANGLKNTPEKQSLSKYL